MALDPLLIGFGATQRGFGGGNIRAVAEQLIDDLRRSRGAAYQHALLGEVSFDLITYFEGHELSFGADYAEHALIEGKPRLQFIGDRLDERNWSLVFHAGFCDPEAELQKLRRLIASHGAAPLTFANGDHKGFFVPLEASVGFRQSSRDGTAIWIEASLKLREHVAPQTLVEQVASQAPTAAEIPASGGSTRKPPRTVQRTPQPRAANAPATRY